MLTYIELSGPDETLAASLYTSPVSMSWSQLRLADFNYTISAPQKSLLNSLSDVFGEALILDAPPEHQILVERGEVQSAADLALVQRMGAIQAQTLTP